MKKLGLLLSIISLFLIGCGGPEAALEISSSGGSAIKVGETVTVLLRTYDAGSSNITYQFKNDPSNVDWVNQTTSSYYTTSYSSTGTKTIQGRFYDGTTYSNIDQVFITVTSGSDTGGGTVTGPFDDDGTPAGQPVHTNITASTFWAGEGASGANHDISNVPSAWDATWGDKFGVEDWPELPRDGNLIPTDSRYKKQENPYYFALPYNDYGNLVYDGEAAATNVANLKSEYTSSYSADYGRNIVTTSSIGWIYDDERKQSVSSIPWKAGDGSLFWSWAGKSMVKGRWARIRYNGINVYAQWMDAGPYHYDDIDYVFGSATPRNMQTGLKDNPNAGIDLSPSVMLKLGVVLGWAGANIDGVEWQFVNAKDVPEGPWRLYPSNANTDW